MWTLTSADKYFGRDQREVGCKWSASHTRRCCYPQKLARLVGGEGRASLLIITDAVAPTLQLRIIHMRFAVGYSIGRLVYNLRLSNLLDQQGPASIRNTRPTATFRLVDMQCGPSATPALRASPMRQWPPPPSRNHMNLAPATRKTCWLHKERSPARLVPIMCAYRALSVNPSYH